MKHLAKKFDLYNLLLLWNQLAQDSAVHKQPLDQGDLNNFSQWVWLRQVKILLRGFNLKRFNQTINKYIHRQITVASTKWRQQHGSTCFLAMQHSVEGVKSSDP